MNDPSAWVMHENGWSHAKHRSERAVNGFSYADWINFADYITWVNIQALEQFKTGSGHPVYGEVQTMDDWIRVLDEMIRGFKAQNSLQSAEYYQFDDEAGNAKRRKMLQARFEKGMAQYTFYFSSLWD